MVEFALVLPLLLAFTMGTFSLGWGFYAQQVIASASRQGAAYLALHPDATDAQLTQATIFGVAGISTDPGLLHVAASPSDPLLRLPETTITVTVSYDYYPVLPIGRVVALLNGSPSTAGDYFLLTAAASRRVE